MVQNWLHLRWKMSDEPTVTIKPESIVTVTPPVPATVPSPQPGRVEDKLPSVTTPEEDRTTASQRRVNIIWETTQAIIAIFITVTACVVYGVRALSTTPLGAAAEVLSNAFFLIVGFYFSRTNHTKTGGVGSKEGKER